MSETKMLVRTDQAQGDEYTSAKSENRVRWVDLESLDGEDLKNALRIGRARAVAHGARFDTEDSDLSELAL